VIYFVYTIHVIVCVFLILVVLLQQGKGADLSVFGGGSTQTAFGARGAATLLHKLTVVSFVLFIVTTMSIAFLQGGTKGASVMSGVTAEQEKEQAEEPVAGEGTAGEATAPPPAEAPPLPAEATGPAEAPAPARTPPASDAGTPAPPSPTE
jgi:preprotein translocase subunit SecG